MKRFLSLFLLFALLLSAGACGGRSEATGSAAPSGFTLVEGTTTYRTEGAQETFPQSNYPFQREDIQLDGQLVGLAQGRDGTMYALEFRGGKLWLLRLDESGKEKERLSLPIEVDTILDGGGDYDLFATSGNTVYALDFSAKTLTSLFDMLQLGMTNVMALVPQGDGFFVFPDLSTCYLLTPDTGESGEKTVLTFATITSTREQNELIAEFNATHSDYVIELEEYGVDGMDRLLTELVAGDVPDMINVGSYDLPVDRMIEKGYLEDLYPYLDADPELSRESIMPNVRTAFEHDGKLYEAFSSFRISVFLTCVDGLTDNLDELVREQLDILDAGGEPKPLIAQRGSHGGIPYYLAYTHWDQYIDWEAGTCSFESESFINLLRYTSSLPLEDDYTADTIKNGDILFLTTWINRPNKLAFFRAAYGDDVQVHGIPGFDGVSRNYIIRSSDIWSICSGSEHKDVCWEFIRRLWLRDYQNNLKDPFARSMNMPSNEEAFYDGIERQRNASDEAYTNDIVDSISYEYPIKPTEEDIERFIELVYATDHADHYDSTLVGIINEECNALFAGDRTPEETAHLIQQRVSIYVAEQS